MGSTVSLFIANISTENGLDACNFEKNAFYGNTFIIFFIKFNICLRGCENSDTVRFLDNDLNTMKFTIQTIS